MCTTLSYHRTVLIVLAAVIFAVCVLLFVQLYELQFSAEPVQARSSTDIFEDFSTAYDLSAREREVLRLVLEDKTNKEIAGTIFVTERTVKFHITNLLKKTGCKDRGELRRLYLSER
ncbi:MAG: helix-turn-helix transcriptional regulator [Ruminococcus sp.]|nr:helix-turn-helix transcriptional regulator [Ruminococcus sp.]